MSKGEKLNILLDKSEMLYKQMNQIFLKKGLTTPDLNLLSAREKEEWYKLHEQYKEISDEICQLINNK